MNQTERALVCMDAALEGSTHLGLFTREDMVSALDHMSRMRSTGDVAEARERLIDALFYSVSPVMTKPSKRRPEAERVECMRFAVRAGSIRICGYRDGKLYDQTFGVGDTVAVGSYNLTYVGTILSVGKTVKVRHELGRTEMLSISDFSFRNYDLDLARISDENASTMQHI